MGEPLAFPFYRIRDRNDHSTFQRLPSHLDIRDTKLFNGLREPESLCAAAAGGITTVATVTTETIYHGHSI